VKTKTKNESLLLEGDCLDILPTIKKHSVDIIAFSPPYNLAIKYNTYKDKLPNERYLIWMDKVALALKRVLKADGSLFLNVGATNVKPWISHDIAQVFRTHFVLQNHIVWVKSISVGEDTFGHFKPVNSKRYMNHTNEDIFHFTSSGSVEIDRLAVGVPYKDKSNIARRGHAQDRRCGGNSWYIPYEHVNSKAEKFNHPAGYPVELASRCIKLHGNLSSNIVVLDPFMGTGTTLLAAQQLGCKGIGIEIDPTYIKTAKKRLGLDD
jgi:site-specific DNA-methyltransferase (adenine-specific)